MGFLIDNDLTILIDLTILMQVLPLIHYEFQYEWIREVFARASKYALDYKVRY